MNTTATITADESRRHSFVGVKGDLRVELHYADVHDGAGWQGCLYIARKRAPQDGVLVPFAGMWRYAQADAIDKIVKPLAAKLYSFVTQQDEFRVLDAVLDYLEDLKNHPPEPGTDKSLDEFLAECEEADSPFFFEINGERVLG